MGNNGSDDELLFSTKEEKPVIAAVIDDRPLEMRRKDIDRNRWRTVESNAEEEANNKKKKSEFVLEISSAIDPKRKRNDSEKDLSPPRLKSVTTARRRHDSDLSVARSDSSRDVKSEHRCRSRTRAEKDLSPPRQRPSQSVTKSRHDSDSDLSPPRPPPSQSAARRRHDSDSDLSPPRLETSKGGTSDKKREKTLSGKKAGLSEAKHLKEELMANKKREDKLFASISEEMLGKNAKTVFRDSKSGRVRNLEEEAKAQNEKDAIKDKIEAEKKAKYEKWSKGLVQTQERQEKRESDLHEMSKPLARYSDDADMDKMLREREREDDPMLQAIKQNKTKKQMAEEGITVRPEYKGPPPPINRFGIKPGYRWDGVDRSNGFEKKHFERISSKVSIQEEAYKWSTQDM